MKKRRTHNKLNKFLFAGTIGLATLFGGSALAQEAQTPPKPKKPSAGFEFEETAQTNNSDTNTLSRLELFTLDHSGKKTKKPFEFIAEQEETTAASKKRVGIKLSPSFPFYNGVLEVYGAGDNNDTTGMGVMFQGRTFGNVLLGGTFDKQTSKNLDITLDTTLLLGRAGYSNPKIGTHVVIGGGKKTNDLIDQDLLQGVYAQTFAKRFGFSLGGKYFGETTTNADNASGEFNWGVMYADEDVSLRFRGSQKFSEGNKPGAFYDGIVSLDPTRLKLGVIKGSTNTRTKGLNEITLTPNVVDFEVPTIDEWGAVTLYTRHVRSPSGDTINLASGSLGLHYFGLLPEFDEPGNSNLFHEPRILSSYTRTRSNNDTTEVGTVGFGIDIWKFRFNYQAKLQKGRKPEHNLFASVSATF